MAYYQSAIRFLTWAEGFGVRTLSSVEPVHVAAWVELNLQSHAIATVKQRLAGLKMLFDWLVVRRVINVNPAQSVRSPRQTIGKGKAPVLDPSEARRLIAAIDVSTDIGLRDRALIGTMLYTFGRIGAVLMMRVRDVYPQNRRLWVRLHEKGGKLHDMPCHHELEEWLSEYIERCSLLPDPHGWLFPSWDRESGSLGSNRLAHPNAFVMVKRRARAAGIETQINNHSFRATGITAYLLNGGTLEKAAKMANHASTRTTQLYDRRDDQIVLGEIEKVRF
ncbi:tyrosine-type recombinase/integrase [Neoaquamicrobium microcysteis]|uniref:tyrosine-type recombinase/integrase n=1 Tax=Neoaquamicrobium microcysteis TaxID=2682781 RepID=UPI001F2FFBA9|nr:tyrosine-type recombinase/integrase [Mesorhizobium microcysteis]